MTTQEMLDEAWEAGYERDLRDTTFLSEYEREGVESSQDSSTDTEGVLMSGAPAAWEQPDEIEEDFKSGNFGKRDEFENWPEEAYSNHPMYQMFLLLKKSESEFWAKAKLWPAV